MSLPVPAILLIAAAMIAGTVGYVLFYRYTNARAVESGLRPWQAHVGQTDDSGATALERKIHWELLLGRYETSDATTLNIGRASRRWTFASVGLTVAAIAVLAHAN
jgi:hypothetical protein